MKRRFTILTAALALLTFLAVPMGMWGQTKATVTDNMTAADLAATGTSYTAFSNVSLTSDAVYAGKSALNNNANIQLRSSGSDCGIVTTVSGGKIKSITINVASGSNTIDVYGKNTAYTGAAQLYNATNQGTKLGSVSSTGTITVSGDYEYVGVRSYNGAVYISSISFVWETASSTATATTVTIDDSGITNTDVYVNTAAGSLSATVTENVNNTTISGATVTWSSSDTNVATVGENGAITLVAAGTTTITASYGGQSGVYGSSSATYELTVTNSEPYVQPTTIEIIPNYTFWGKTGQFSGNTYDELDGSQDNVSLHWTRGNGSTYANLSAMRFYKDNDLTFNAPEGYEIISIKLSVTGAYNDLTFDPTGFDNETTTWTGAAETVTMSRPSNADSYAQISKFIITLAAIGNAVATTTSINVPANFNNDIYQGTNAGTLTATVKDNENNTISGATVTWESSNTGVATIDANGAVTLVGVGTVTFTASYAGVEDEYQASSATYELTVTSSAPYVQPNPVEINMNYVWLGSGNGSNLNANQLPVEKVDDNVTTTITDGTSNHPRGDSDYIRIYIGSTLTFNAPDGYVITGIEFTTGGNNTWNAPTTSTGTLSNKTWTGDATSVVFTMTGSCFISKATITLDVPSTEPYITVESDSFELTANEEEGYLEITYDNFTPTSLDVMFCDANGDALSEDPDWITLAIEAPAGETGDFVYYYAEPNVGAARTAYFKVYASLGENQGEVYSNLVTVTQAAVPVDYASLPFIWEGGTSGDLGNENGVTVYSDSDYAEQNAPYRVKFSASTHYILVKTNDQPAVVSVGIKKFGSGNGSTLNIEGSSDGQNFTTVQSFTISGAQNDELTFTTTNAFNANYRYVKISFNKPSSGGANVGVGPITIRGIETYTLTIAKHGATTADGGWYLIASPVASVTPSTENGFIAEPAVNYDLYYFDQSSANKEWKNYKKNNFNLVSGKGYLYANGSENGTTLTFTGTPYTGDGKVTLTYTASADFAGFNLIGNPFSTAATIDMPFYRMNAAGTAFVASTESGQNQQIAAMEGVFVYAYDEGQSQAITTATFTRVSRSGNAPQGIVNLNVERNASVVDNAIVRFDGGLTLPKFMFNEDNTKLYIPQNGKDYAIVSAQANGEMPVSFKASENGTYTLTVSPENVEMNYLHLIDNMTGMDIDLLQTPSYSFEASTRDYESRFRLVFNANNANGTANAETFAYYNGNEWVIANDGTATLQVVDMMGRIVSTQTVNGNTSLSTNGMSTGVYVMRLVNGNDVKTQKIVVR